MSAWQGCERRMTVGCRQPPTVCRARTPTELSARLVGRYKAVRVDLSQRRQALNDLGGGWGEEAVSGAAFGVNRERPV
jgi:hypothetical protein